LQGKKDERKTKREKKVGREVGKRKREDGGHLLAERRK
jgi:hypothetical protein